MIVRSEQLCVLIKENSFCPCHTIPCFPFSCFWITLSTSSTIKHIPNHPIIF